VKNRRGILAALLLCLPLLPLWGETGSLSFSVGNQWSQDGYVKDLYGVNSLRYNLELQLNLWKGIGLFGRYGRASQFGKTSLLEEETELTMDPAVVGLKVGSAVFIKGGALWMRFREKSDRFDFKDNVQGWYAGGGVRLKLFKPIALAVEGGYSWADYENSWGETLKLGGASTDISLVLIF